MQKPTFVKVSDATVLFTVQQSLLDCHIIGDMSPTKLSRNNINPACDPALSELPKDESL